MVAFPPRYITCNSLNGCLCMKLRKLAYHSLLGVYLAMTSNFRMQILQEQGLCNRMKAALPKRGLVTFSAFVCSVVKEQ